MERRGDVCRALSACSSITERDSVYIRGRFEESRCQSILVPSPPEARILDRRPTCSAPLRSSSYITIDLAQRDAVRSGAGEGRDDARRDARGLVERDHGHDSSDRVDSEAP